MAPSTAGDSGDAAPERVVYDLAPDCTLDDVEVGARYLATVNGVVEYGVFVDISEHVSGLVHDSKLDGTYSVGDELVVELLEIRENGDLGFSEIDAEFEDVTEVSHGYNLDVR